MNPVGRPTRFVPGMVEQAHNYCLLGATNDELALFFGVCPATIDNWIARRAEFGEAVKSGRVVADARVARGLFDRAVGYDRHVERQVVLDGAVKALTSTVHYPPNVQACIFWLRNRRRRTWSEAPSEAAAPVIDDIALLDATGEGVLLDDDD
ncbi:MAG: hypothetical protein FJX11_17240 [Alphaproteobacteria bacterium]|nr:hypothetical protein [Alphaproteobacteria bacterium]